MTNTIEFNGKIYKKISERGAQRLAGKCNIFAIQKGCKNFNNFSIMFSNDTDFDRFKKDCLFFIDGIKALDYYISC